MNPAVAAVLATGLCAGVAVAGEGKDVFRAPDGKDVAVTCIKHASLRIEYDGREIHVDPVGAGVEPATDYARFPKADLILVTHEHFDHFDRAAIEALRKEGTDVVANPAVREKLGSGDALANGGRLHWRENVSVDAAPAYNTTPGHLAFHPKGRDNGYVLSLGGLKLYIAGDTEDIPEMEELPAIDVAFLPCNQPYTMTPDQLVRAVKAVKPRTVFPYHCGKDDAARAAALLEGVPVDVRLRVGR
jgi:L-ascorbate metabolism protein UlaG (beta-lactamase superfamily)